MADHSPELPPQAPLPIMAAPGESWVVKISAGVAGVVIAVVTGGAVVGNREATAQSPAHMTTDVKAPTVQLLGHAEVQLMAEHAAQVAADRAMAATEVRRAEDLQRWNGEVQGVRSDLRAVVEKLDRLALRRR